MKTKSLIAATLLAAGFISGASAQMPGCQTANGVFPMPNGIPQPGLPCNGPAGPGFTILLGGSAGGGMGNPFPSPVFSPQPFPFPQTRGGLAGTFGANREMQIAAECSSAGNPKVVAGCIAARLTQEEFQKCLNGIGNPGGCIGPGNTLRSLPGDLQRAGDRAKDDFNRSDVSKVLGWKL